MVEDISSEIQRAQELEIELKVVLAKIAMSHSSLGKLLAQHAKVDSQHEELPHMEETLWKQVEEVDTYASDVNNWWAMMLSSFGCDV